MRTGPRGVSIPKETRLAIIALVRAGSSIKAAALEHGVSQATAQAICKAAGVKSQVRGSQTEGARRWSQPVTWSRPPGGAVRE